MWEPIREIRERTSHETRQGTLGHSRLRSLSHCGLLRAYRVKLACTSRPQLSPSPPKKKKKCKKPPPLIIKINIRITRYYFQHKANTRKGERIVKQTGTQFQCVAVQGRGAQGGQYKVDYLQLFDFFNADLFLLRRDAGKDQDPRR